MKKQYLQPIVVAIDAAYAKPMAVPTGEAVKNNDRNIPRWLGGAYLEIHGGIDIWNAASPTPDIIRAINKHIYELVKYDNPERITAMSQTDIPIVHIVNGE